MSTEATVECEIVQRPVEPCERLLQCRDRVDVDHSVDDAQPIEVDLAQHIGDRVGDTLGRLGQVGSGSPMLGDDGDEPRPLSPRLIEIVARTAEQVGRELKALSGFVEVAGLQRSQRHLGLIGTLREVRARRGSSYSEADQRQDRGGDDASQRRPQLQPSPSRPPLNRHQCRGQHRNDRHTPTLIPKCHRLPSLDRICTAMPTTIAAITGPLVARQREVHGAIAMVKTHSPTVAMSRITSTTVDPVGDGPASTTPMPEATPMPATVASMVRTSRLCPSVTIC